MAEQVFMNNFSVVSFNCKHFKDRGPKFEFMQSLMSNTDILMLQEHCLFKSCIEKLKKLNAYADVIGTSPMDESVTLEG